MRRKQKEDKFGNPASDEKAATEVATTEEAPAFPLAEKGKEIFDGKGTCATCHKTDSKLIGPSLQDITKIYKEKMQVSQLSLKAMNNQLLTQLNLR